MNFLFFWLKFIKTYFLKKFNEFLDKQTFFCWITTCTLKNPAYAYCQNQIWQLFHCIFVKLNLFCKTQWAKTQKKMAILGANVFESSSTGGLPNLKVTRSEENSNIALIFVFEVIKYPPGHSFQITIFRSFSSMCTAKLQKR